MAVSAAERAAAAALAGEAAAAEAEAERVARAEAHARAGGTAASAAGASDAHGPDHGSGGGASGLQPSGSVGLAAAAAAAAQRAAPPALAGAARSCRTSAVAYGARSIRGSGDRRSSMVAAARALEEEPEEEAGDADEEDVEVQHAGTGGVRGHTLGGKPCASISQVVPQVGLPLKLRFELSDRLGSATSSNSRPTSPAARTNPGDAPWSPGPRSLGNLPCPTTADAQQPVPGAPEGDRRPWDEPAAEGHATPLATPSAARAPHAPTPSHRLGSGALDASPAAPHHAVRAVHVAAHVTEHGEEEDPDLAALPAPPSLRREQAAAAAALAQAAQAPGSAAAALTLPAGAAARSPMPSLLRQGSAALPQAHASPLARDFSPLGLYGSASGPAPLLSPMASAVGLAGALPSPPRAEPDRRGVSLAGNPPARTSMRRTSHLPPIASMPVAHVAPGEPPASAGKPASPLTRRLSNWLSPQENDGVEGRPGSPRGGGGAHGASPLGRVLASPFSGLGADEGAPTSAPGQVRSRRASGAGCPSSVGKAVTAEHMNS
jgi:hypothetical protein